MTISIDGLISATFGNHTRGILHNNQSETLSYYIEQYAGWENIGDYGSAYSVGHSIQEATFIQRVFETLDPYIDLDFQRAYSDLGSDIDIYSVNYSSTFSSDANVGQVQPQQSWWDVMWKDTDGLASLNPFDANTIVHEIGQALGLSHPYEDPTNGSWNTDDTVMSYNISLDGWDYWFSDSDIAALQTIWGLENDHYSMQKNIHNGREYLSDGVDQLTGQANFSRALMAGDDFLDVIGGSNNFANGNKGSDHIVLRGGQGRYLGGADSDTMEVFDAITGSLVNGNKGNDVVTGNAAGVTYRGGADNDILAVSQGNAWGDKGAGTFRGVVGDGFVTLEDYTPGEDMVQLGMAGSWSQFGNGQMFTSTDGDQLMLLAGIASADQITLV